ncbi:MAG: hypothetical protein ACXVPQ_00810 [Bacteroidia bacterium]
MEKQLLIEDELLFCNGRAGVFLLRNGMTVNYGGIGIEGLYYAHYTGKGLRELFPQNEGALTAEEKQKLSDLRTLSREELIRQGYIKLTLISDIAKILS